MSDNSRSPALQYAVPKESAVPSDAEFEAAFKSLGVDGEAEDKKDADAALAQRTQQIKELTAQRQAQELKVKALETVDTYAVQPLAGLGQGIIDISKNTYNGLLVLADSAENYAASKGIGTGDLIREDMKLGPSANEQYLNPSAQMVRKVTNYAGPAIAAYASGGGALLSAGVGAVYSFLGIDPKEQRLADQLKDTSLSEYPLAMAVIEPLTSKPTDTELMSRTKNFVEGLGVEAAVGGMLFGATKLYGGITHLRNPKVLKDEAIKIQATDQIITAAERARATPVTEAEKAALNASDAAISSPTRGQVEVKRVSDIPPGPERQTEIDSSIAKLEEEAQTIIKQNGGDEAALMKAENGTLIDIRNTQEELELVSKYGTKAENSAAKAAQEDMAQMDLFSKEWAEYMTPPTAIGTDATGNIITRIGDDDVVQAFSNMIGNKEAEAFLRGPVTDAELFKAAQQMKNDPDTLKKIANWKPGDPTPAAESLLTLKVVTGSSEKSLQASITRAVTEGTDGARAALLRDLENYAKIDGLRRGVTSEQGRSFRANQLVAHLAGLGDAEALKVIGAEGRSRLTNGVINKYGGAAKLKEMSENLDFINEMAKISQIPDKDFANRMGQIVQKSRFMKIEDAITKVALNGMLSSPVTWGKAFLTNAGTTGKTVIDNYLEVGIGAFSKGDSKTLAEANAHLRGVMLGFFDGIRPAAKAMRDGVAPNAKIMRMDLTPALKKTEIADVMEMAGGAWAHKVGVPIDTAVSTPGRVLLGVDTYWQHINYQGVVRAEAIKRGTAQGLEGAKLSEFMEGFLKNVPEDVDKIASELASTNTMAKQLDGWVGKIEAGYSSSPIPFNKVILPFIKTNINLVEYTAKNSPLAPFSAEFRAAMQAGGRAKHEALAKVTSGTTAIAGLMYLASEGLITGPASQNPEFKDNQTLPLDTSIKMGDKWVSLRGLEPFSTMVNMASFLSKARGFMSEEEYGDMAMTFKIMATDALTPEALTGGLSEMLNVITDEEGSKMLRTGSSVAARFMPFGAAINDVRQMVDRTSRDTLPAPAEEGKWKGMQDFYQAVVNKYSNMIPYYSKDLPPIRNFWGEKVSLPDGIGPDEMSPLATSSDEMLPMKKAVEGMNEYYEFMKDKVDVAKVGIRMPVREVPNPVASGLKIPLTPHQYSDYLIAQSGIDPATGKPLTDQGYPVPKMKDVVYTILQEENLLGQDFKSMDYTVYNRAVGKINAQLLRYKDLADKYITSREDIRSKALDQGRRSRMLQEANGGSQ